MTVSGIDVSHYQGTINWKKVKDAGVKFALIRIGYGDTLSYPGQIDSMYQRNYKECKSVGLPVGGYFYSYATTVEAAKREAQSCLALIKGKQFEYPIYYDVEEMRIFNTGRTNEIIKAFCQTLENAGWFAGVYIYRSAAQSYLSRETKQRYAMAISEYGSKCNYDGQYGVWQNSCTWRVAGINGNVDHDWCYVDYPAVIKKAGRNGFSSSKPSEPAKHLKTVDEIAREVIRGDWGVGAERKRRLTAAGYDYDAVQRRVEQLLGQNSAQKTSDQIAREVIRGDWGAGEDRKKRLTAAGYDYNKVQKRVEQLIAQM